MTRQLCQLRVCFLALCASCLLAPAQATWWQPLQSAIGGVFGHGEEQAALQGSGSNPSATREAARVSKVHIGRKQEPVARRPAPVELPPVSVADSRGLAVAMKAVKEVREEARDAEKAMAGLERTESESEAAMALARRAVAGMSTERGVVAAASAAQDEEALQMEKDLAAAASEAAAQDGVAPKEEEDSADASKFDVLTDAAQSYAVTGYEQAGKPVPVLAAGAFLSAVLVVGGAVMVLSRRRQSGSRHAEVLDLEALEQASE